jgi:hypothetical protein
MSSKLEIHGVVKHDFQVERVEDSFESDANEGGEIEVARVEDSLESDANEGDDIEVARVEDSLESDANEGDDIEVARVEDSLESDANQGDDIEVERVEDRNGENNDNNMAHGLDIDLNLPAHHDFDLNELPIEHDEDYAEREIKAEVRRVLNIFVPTF